MESHVNIIEKTFADMRVRAIEIDGTLWFVAVDVCRALGLSDDRGMHMHLKKLDSDQVRFVLRSDVTPTADLTSIAVRNYPNRGASCITEAGVYALIFRSDKPLARRFQNWVCREVLPAIEKDGGYIMGEENVRSGEMSEDELIRRATAALEAKLRKREHGSQDLREMDYSSSKTIDGAYRRAGVRAISQG